MGDKFQQRNMVKPGEGGSTLAGPRKPQPSTNTTANLLKDLLSQFVTFLAGVEIYGGLTVNDFLNVYGYTIITSGAEVSGGLKTDNVTVTGYWYLTPSGTDENTVGSYRFYIDSGTPLPKLQMEQLITAGEWKWVGEFGPYTP